MSILKTFQYFNNLNLSASARSLSSTFSSGIIQNFNAEIANGGIVPGFKLAPVYKDRIAIQDCYGKLTYDNLFRAAKKFSIQLSEVLGGQKQKTISYLCKGDSTHVLVQWAIWMSGNIAVPLSPQHPPPLLEYFLEDSGTALVICDKKLVNILPNSCKENVQIIDFPVLLHAEAVFKSDSQAIRNNDNMDENVFEDLPDGKFYANSDALILYTSGTTSKPKGVVHGFKQLAFQIASLHTAWKYSCNDVLLHTLPLHHVHGQINSVAAGLAAGAMLRMLPNFNPTIIWSHLLGVEKGDHRRVNVLMGVPTMYTKLIDEFDKVLAKKVTQKEYIRNLLVTKMRLMISGSAPLPVPIYERWEEISGHKLLERYGMTEIGMAISNPYEPMNKRIPGFIGLPLPGVSIQIASIDPEKNITPLIILETPPPNLQINLSNYNYCLKVEEPSKNLFILRNEEKRHEPKCKITYMDNKSGKNQISGELLVRGSSVFNKYWNRPEQTKSEFTPDGWFKTGDTASFDGGIIKLLGRTSVDIIKSGGYKISALDVETLVLGHPNIADVAIVGMPDLTWGEKVVAIVELKNETSLTLKELQNWGLKFIPRYQLPTELFIVEKLPRNLMGKVNKKELCQKFVKNKRS
ncbi:acyl-CoA synthetase family member 3 [Arctopsyche grandis]|uniref:acyl-CoA synthetase family member 3 n=1 Tax=Arctopsyche grandis TaxID=121162 RepID=UPI00406D9109